MKVKVLLNFRSKRLAFLSDALVQIRFQALYFLFDFLLFSISAAIAVVDVNKLFRFFPIKQPSFYRCTIHIKTIIVSAPLVLKRPHIFQNDFPDKALHSLGHDKKAISHLIHVCQVLPAEITPVQDESQIPVSEAVCLINHAGKLRHVIDTSGILFIKQRLPVGYVESHRVVIDRLPCIHLCISILQKLDVSRLTVFVCGIIGNIDLLAFVSSFVPGIQKTDDLLRLEALQKIRKF